MHNPAELEAQVEPAPQCNSLNMEKRVLIHSGSTDEDSPMQAEVTSLQNEDNESTVPLLDDSEDEDDVIETANKSTKKAFKLIDTDSEPPSDEEVTDTIDTNVAPIYTVNDKKELVPERDISAGLAALCDPESSDDENKSIQPLAYKKSRKKGDETENQSMSARDAVEQRKEIESVSQRMLREKHIALPYHKPKQRSLKEFLQNRPKFATTVPDAISKAPASIAIKMSKEQLDIVSKRIEEREKQVEEFYKSDDEEEENVEEVDTATELPQSQKNIEETLEDVSVDLNVAENNDANDESHTVHAMKEVDESLETSGIANMETEGMMEAMKIETPGSSKFNLSDSENENIYSSHNEQSSTNEKNFVHELNENDVEKQASTKPSALQMLKEQLGDTQPKLSGSPNYVIDLDDGTTHLDEVTQLMQRFSKHTCKKSVQKKASAVELDILYVSQGGEIHKEKVAVKLDDHDEPPIVEKPGLKYLKLKNDLQTQMAIRRNEVWKEKQTKWQAEKEENEEYDIYKGEKDECGIDDILADEEEEFSNAGSDEEEDEEDNDGVNQEKAENAEALIDNEASEDEQCSNEYDDEIEEDNELMPKPKRMIKQLRRIVQPVDSDSDDENACNQSVNQSKQMDSTVSWPDDDDFISAGQTNSCRTPVKQSCMQTKSELAFLSPVCRLTGLQSFDATGKFLQNSPGSPAIKLGEASPFAKSAGPWAKSLFNDSPCKTQNLEDICSGTFSSPLSAKDGETDKSVAVCETENVENSDSQNVPSTQDMIELCSGNFDFTQSEGIISHKDNKHSADENSVADGIDNADSKSDEVVNIEKPSLPVTSECKEAIIDEDDDRFISQIIDEDELESFKKKFESPLQTTYNAPPTDERIATKIAFDALNHVDDDSSDEDLQVNTQKRHKKNKLIDSDDENNDDGNDDENIDLQDEVDEVDGEDNNFETELGYDSEENEILVEKNVKPKKLKLKDFLENEAELSESEWGSEDEDEQNLDVMELEEGDNEQFDEKKLKDDLEKIHMKRILDEDKKNLKVLQELYLDEDDELKGAGRQRQFRWRNIDNVDNEGSSNPEEIITQLDDEGENEEEWRKKRYERELFLQSQKQDDEDASISLKGPNTQLFKLGQRAVIKNKQTVKTASQLTKKTSTFNTQRGSFLSRKDQVLTRVAEYTKVGDVNLGAPKNSRNFVFQSISKDVNSCSTTNIEDKKRKAADAGTPAQLKRLRLNGFSPADQKKKAETRSKARLFCNKQW